MADRKAIEAALLALAGGVFAACATQPEAPRDLGWAASPGAEAALFTTENPEDLKRQMQQAHRDLIHFHSTLAGLRFRGDRTGFVQLTAFVDAYMAQYLDPMLQAGERSRPPELIALDANLRLAKADTLIEMGDLWRAHRVLVEIERRFRGHEATIVEYPFGAQSTLGEGLARVRERMRRG